MLTMLSTIVAVGSALILTLLCSVLILPLPEILSRPLRVQTAGVPPCLGDRNGQADPRNHVL
jgi:hypothetical protein